MKNIFLKYLRWLVLLFYSIFSSPLSAQNYVNDTSKINESAFINEMYFFPECYKSEKLNKLIPKRYSYEPKVITESNFKALNAYEHFVHAFYYPETYRQSCSLFPLPENLFSKIPMRLPRIGEGLVMSERQTNAIVQNRDSTIVLIENCIVKTGVVSDEFKRVIVRLNALELIPVLVTTIENQQEVKDPYILTTLCLLMRYGYPPFKSAEIYKQLYPIDSASYFFSNDSYLKFIPFTNSNYQSILDLSNACYAYFVNHGSEFISIDGGTYTVGESKHGINPQRSIELYPFQISKYEITNSQFNEFVGSTDYITTAEKNKNALVFRPGLDEFEWIQDSTANWRFPNGVSEGGIENKMNHPVTCISFIDAQAYCKWAHVRLPTFDEWEVASRAGQSEKRYFFGDSIEYVYPYANVWHGKTHLMIYEGEDAITTAPVGSYLPNNYGIFDMYGNVFEFCTGLPESFKTMQNVAVSRGGSWWCSISACGFFNSVDIGRVQIDASFSNNGFRVVL